MRPTRGAVFLRQELGEFVLTDLGVLQVDWQRQVHRAGAAGGGGAEGRGHEFRDALLVVDQPGPLGDRSGHADLVNLLEGGHTLFRQLGAARNEDNRALRGVDRRKGRDGVGEAGPAGEYAHGRLAGYAGVAVGHVQGSALVTSVDELYALIRSRIHQRQYCVADDGEYLLDAFLFQASDEQMSSGESGHGPSWISVAYASSTPRERRRR